ncbi:glycerate kinase [Vibrio ezurae]|uniref:Glycerate kinase GarK n=1 Tax=Vibrio ezurae NBRC 102218 TaxID=1219080 RepID=U3AYX4_9VIBR|nr:glycerate kinase [Vibrio ezurae]GAD78945.1 glycerate kinase GarK [Vibrio ezurae NBRC 102218]
MKIVIAPDSFKESLSAKAVCECIERGFKVVFPDAEYHHLPLADGGEGTVEALTQGRKARLMRTEVSDPIGKKVWANWALLDNDKTALIEIAAASGLALLAPEDRNPNITSSYGTGELIRTALDQGVTKILLGLGGSATNDAGAGIVQALGGKLLSHTGTELQVGASALTHLAKIDLSQQHPRCSEVEFIVACDVSNPLTGQRGASHVFGRQKGASSEMINALDAAIHHFAQLSIPILGTDHRHTPGFGAAGGTPLGLSLLFDITIKPGIDMILDELNADHIMQDASLMITGEGRMDTQTLQGKTPFGVALRANQKGIPVIAIAGSLGKELDPLYTHFNGLFASVRAPQSLDSALSEAEVNITSSARNVAAMLKLGAVINK